MNTVKTIEKTPHNAFEIPAVKQLMGIINKLPMMGAWKKDLYEHLSGGNELVMKAGIDSSGNKSINLCVFESGCEKVVGSIAVEKEKWKPNK